MINVISWTKAFTWKVAICWGATNPLIKAGTAGLENISRSYPQGGLKRWAAELVYLLTRWQVQRADKLSKVWKRNLLLIVLLHLVCRASRAQSKWICRVLLHAGQIRYFLTTLYSQSSVIKVFELSQRCLLPCRSRTRWRSSFHFLRGSYWASSWVEKVKKTTKPDNLDEQLKKVLGSHQDTWIGMALVVVGVIICVSSKATS